MTNDNQAPAQPLDEKFRVGLLELIGICMEAGLHPYRIVEIMDAESKTMREDNQRVDREGR
jgi:hypothetical protein